MLPKPVAIGGLAAATGVKVPTIRYYEGVGLLPKPSRTDSNRRLYNEDAISRLRFIRHARELGFEIDDIRQLLRLADEPNRPCREVDAIAKRHVAEIESRMTRLAALRAEICRMIDECARDKVSQCRIIEVLSNHGECLNESH